MFQQEIMNEPIHTQQPYRNADAGLWDVEDLFRTPHPVIRKWLHEYLDVRISWQDALILIFKDTQVPCPAILEQHYILGNLTYEEFLIERVRYAVSTGSSDSATLTNVSASVAR